MQLSAGAMTAGLATTNIAHAESAAQKARAVDHLRQARSLASFSGGELGAVQAASFFLYTTVYKNSLLSSRKKAMRICLANRRKGNSKGKLYLGSNQFLGCGIAATPAKYHFPALVAGSIARYNAISADDTNVSMHREGRASLIMRGPRIPFCPRRPSAGTCNPRPAFLPLSRTAGCSTSPK